MSLYSSIQRSACSLEILLLRRIVSAITVIVTESCDTFTLNLLRLLSSDTTHIQTTTSLSVKKSLVLVLWCLTPLSTILNLYHAWRSVLLVEETRVPGEKHQPVASNLQTLSHNVESSTPLVVIGTHCTGSCKTIFF